MRYEYCIADRFRGRHQLQPRFGRSILCGFLHHDCRHVAEGAATGRFLAYNQAYWNAAVRVTKNQVLQDPDLTQPISKPYERVPQVTVNGYVADWRGFEFTASLDATPFSTRRWKPAVATSPTCVLRIRFWRPAGSSFRAHACRPLRMTSIPHSIHLNCGPPGRMPILSLDMGLVFDREVGWFGRAARTDARAAAVLRVYPVSQSEQPAELRQRAGGSVLRAAIYREHLLGIGPNLERESTDRRADDAHTGR